MSIVKHISLLFLPASVVVLAAILYLETQTAQTEAATLQRSAARVQQFAVLEYPENTQLLQLPRELPSAELLADMDIEIVPEENTNRIKTLQSSQVQVNADNLEFSLDDIDLSSLSPDLALKVENAFSAKGKSTLHSSQSLNDLEGNTLRWQGRLPALNLQTHMYASNAERRWVKINNVEYHQGETVDGQVTLKEILPQAVIIEFEGEQIRIPALYEWQG